MPALQLVLIDHSHQQVHVHLAVMMNVDFQSQGLLECLEVREDLVVLGDQLVRAQNVHPCREHPVYTNRADREKLIFELTLQCLFTPHSYGICTVSDVTILQIAAYSGDISNTPLCRVLWRRLVSNQHKFSVDLVSQKNRTLLSAV